MAQRGKSAVREGGSRKEVRRTFKMLREVWLNIGVEKIDTHEGVVTPYKRLGKISDILHLNNENNQLERRARPPKDVSLDAQSWTRAYDLSSRVVAVTTTTETS